MTTKIKRPAEMPDAAGKKKSPAHHADSSNVGITPPAPPSSSFAHVSVIKSPWLIKSPLPPPPLSRPPLQTRVIKSHCRRVAHMVITQVTSPLPLPPPPPTPPHPLRPWWELRATKGSLLLSLYSRSEYSFACCACLQGFYLPSFCLPGSFNFLFSLINIFNPQRWNVF